MEMNRGMVLRFNPGHHHVFPDGAGLVNQRLHQRAANPFALMGRVDMVLNTIPARVLGTEALAALPKGAWLLELASAPYGFDRDAAASMGLNVEVLPALPARYAPRSAARALKPVSMELLREASL